MTRVFENPKFPLRLNIYLIVLIIVMANGVRELWVAFGAPVLDWTGVAFGAAFLAGGAYGIYQTFRDGCDLVAAFDADLASGQGIVTLWRPFRRMRIEGPLDRIKGWRFWIKSGQSGQRSYMLFADFPGYPRRLQLELRRGEPVSEGLRQLAPTAISDFEDATGATRDATAAGP